MFLFFVIRKEVKCSMFFYWGFKLLGFINDFICYFCIIELIMVSEVFNSFNMLIVIENIFFGYYLYSVKNVLY